MSENVFPFPHPFSCLSFFAASFLSQPSSLHIPLPTTDKYRSNARTVQRHGGEEREEQRAAEPPVRHSCGTKRREERGHVLPLLHLPPRPSPRRRSPPPPASARERAPARPHCALPTAEERSSGKDAGKASDSAARKGHVDTLGLCAVRVCVCVLFAV